MGNALGPKKTTKQIVREQKRMIDRSIRQLERERAGLARDETKLIAEIKKNAKANQMSSVRIQAKDLVRLRKSQTKFIELNAQLRAISLQMTAVASTAQLQESMKQVSKSMHALNKQMNLPELQKVMRQFAQESEKMEMKQEMMGEALDDAMEDVEDEEEEERVVNEVLDEIGLNLGEAMVDAPVSAKEQVVEEESSADRELEARLNNLKR